LRHDIFAGIVFSARTALLVGYASAIVGGFVGLVLGVASAWLAGWIDLLLQRVMDIMMAFPLIVMALAIVSPAEKQPARSGTTTP